MQRQFSHKSRNMAGKGREKAETRKIRRPIYPSELLIFAFTYVLVNKD